MNAAAPDGALLRRISKKNLASTDPPCLGEALRRGALVRIRPISYETPVSVQDKPSIS